MSPALLNSRMSRSRSTGAAIATKRQLANLSRPSTRATSADGLSRPGSAGYSSSKGGYGSTSTSATGRFYSDESNRDSNRDEPPRYDAPSKQRATVEDMLKYILDLGMDLTQDADMFWIAEQAFQAEAPPIWSSEIDRLGRVCYYNKATGESTWEHPMHETFKTVVTWFREAKAEGGFWNIDKRLKALEIEIRNEMENWCEQIDDHGEKFYLNTKNGDSSYVDPRVVPYYNLHCLAVQVQRMKDEKPDLANAQAPDEPTEEELEEIERQKIEEQKYLKALIKVQCVVRAIAARKRAKRMRERAQVGSAKHGVRLKVSVDEDGNEQLVLSQSTPHRRNKAATKLQATWKMVLMRRQFLPVLQHYRFQAKTIIPLQCMVRCWLARRKQAELTFTILNTKAVKIQQHVRGHQGRNHYRAVLREKNKHVYMVKQVVVLQSFRRSQLAYRELLQLKKQRDEASAKVIVGQLKVFGSRIKLMQEQVKQNPIEVSTDFVDSILNPVRTRFNVVPFDKHGNLYESDDQHSSVELLGDEVWKKYPLRKVIKIQALIRGVLVRLRKKRVKKFVKEIVDNCIVEPAATEIVSVEAAKDSILAGINSHIDQKVFEKHRAEFVGEFATSYLMDSVDNALDARKAAATLIQACARGRLTRKQGLHKIQMKKKMSNVEPAVRTIQSKMKVLVAKNDLHRALHDKLLGGNARKIQSAWRGYLAREHRKQMEEQNTWPVKTLFNYQALGPDSVNCAINILPNSQFDSFKHFLKNDENTTLSNSLADMQAEVSLCVDKFLDNQMASAVKTQLKREESDAVLSSPKALTNNDKLWMEQPASALANFQSPLAGLEGLDIFKNTALPKETGSELSEQQQQPSNIDDLEVKMMGGQYQVTTDNFTSSEAAINNNSVLEKLITWMSKRFGSLVEGLDCLDATGSGELDMIGFLKIVEFGYCSPEEARRLFFDLLRMFKTRADQPAILTWRHFGITKTEWKAHCDGRSANQRWVEQEEGSALQAFRRKLSKELEQKRPSSVPESQFGRLHRRPSSASVTTTRAVVAPLPVVARPSSANISANGRSRSNSQPSVRPVVVDPVKTVERENSNASSFLRRILGSRKNSKASVTPVPSRKSSKQISEPVVVAEKEAVTPVRSRKSSKQSSAPIVIEKESSPVVVSDPSVGSDQKPPSSKASSKRSSRLRQMIQESREATLEEEKSSKHSESEKDEEEPKDDEEPKDTSDDKKDDSDKKDEGGDAGGSGEQGDSAGAGESGADGSGGNTDQNQSSGNDDKDDSGDKKPADDKPDNSKGGDAP
eukprot:gene207-655_t